MSELTLAAVVFDDAIYPRSEWSATTVKRYVEALEAGDRFPPIVLERGTNRLLDGMHRARAHQESERDTIEVEYHEIPAGVPAKLYAASLSAKHGDRVSGEELREIAREIATANPDYDLQTIARYSGVTRKTVGKWVGDITERRRLVRKAQTLILRQMDWPQANIAAQVGVSQRQVSSDLEEMRNDPSLLTEDLLREAAELLPMDCTYAIEEIRQERIFNQWSEDERDLLKRLRDGETIVVSQRTHPNLIGWADIANQYERIDRRTPWGNPFEMPADGDRDTVIGNYRDHYLPYKPSLLGKLSTLKGKALGCWCAPEACHGDVLAAQAGEPR
jgi:hypothetical protein